MSQQYMDTLPPVEFAETCILEITESEAELTKRLQYVREAVQKEKLQMPWWI